MKYLALTIGPIYKTLGYARKTRELWATSFLFSRLMDLLAEEITNQGGKVIQPQRHQAEAAERFGAGIYPDRLFANAVSLDNKKVEAAIEKVIRQLASEVLPSHFRADQGEYDFWKSYFRIGWLINTVENPSGENLFKTFRQNLDTLELQEPYFAIEPPTNYLLKWLEFIYDSKISDALKKSKAKGGYDGLMSNLFPSTSDIATFELYHGNKEEYRKLKKTAKEVAEKGDEDDDKVVLEFYKLLFAKNSPFKKSVSDYHKYFCIVHADGDSFGDTISNLKDEQAFHDFSLKITEYGVEAANLINDYGGKPVYIGGDDLLFFAPVCTEKGSVFQLMQALNTKFNNLKLSDPMPTLSFGLTLTYYKFPLFEARGLSYKQLSDRAKKFKSKGVNKGKNAVAFRLLRHSGSYFEAVLTKEQLDIFIEAEKQLRNTNKSLISSVVYKLDILEKLLAELLEKNQLTIGRLENLFRNFFNEPIHRQYEDQMKLVRELVFAVYSHKAEVDGKELDPNDTLYAVLRLLKFFTDKPF